MNLSTLVVVPLDMAFLCPQCDAGTNMHDCPLCHSETLVLSRILNRTEGAAPKGEEHNGTK